MISNKLFACVFFSAMVFGAVSNGAQSGDLDIINKVQSQSKSVWQLLQDPDYRRIKSRSNLPEMNKQISYYIQRVQNERDIEAIKKLGEASDVLGRLKNAMRNRLERNEYIVERHWDNHDLPKNDYLERTLRGTAQIVRSFYSETAFGRKMRYAKRALKEFISNPPIEYLVQVSIDQIEQQVERIGFKFYVVEELLEYSSDFSKNLMLDRETIFSAAQILRQAESSDHDSNSARKAHAFSKQMKNTLDRYREMAAEMDYWVVRLVSVAIAIRSMRVPRTTTESKHQSKILEEKDHISRKILRLRQRMARFNQMIYDDCEVALQGSWVEYYNESKYEMQKSLVDLWSRQGKL